MAVFNAVLLRSLLPPAPPMQGLHHTWMVLIIAATTVAGMALLGIGIYAIKRHWCAAAACCASSLQSQADACGLRLTKRISI